MGTTPGCRSMLRMWMVCSLAVIFGAGMAACGHKQDAGAMAPSANDVSQFDDAVRDGDTAIVQRLIQAKPGLVNAKDENGQTPLQIANQKQDQAMADLLKKYGGN